MQVVADFYLNRRQIQPIVLPCCKYKALLTEERILRKGVRMALLDNCHDAEFTGHAPICWQCS